MGILPRGYHSAKQPSMYTASINAINKRLRWGGAGLGVYVVQGG